MIRNKNILNIGDRIELIRIGFKEDQSYPSQVLDILGKDRFVISGPIYKNQLAMIHKNQNIKVSYIVENKGRYAFDAKVLRKESSDIYKLEIQKTSNIRRYQQRKYYRLSISLPVTKSSDVKGEGDEEILVENCRTKDISGSGLRLYSNFKHNPGDIIRCKFKIQDHLIDVKGKVIRVDKVDTFDYSYSLGINFLELDENDRDKIIKFIFLKERLLREKGLI
jgi:c-di-GMP-binding flagellar brake protein YcgR